MSPEKWTAKGIGFKEVKRCKKLGRDCKYDINCL